MKAAKKKNSPSGMTTFYMVPLLVSALFSENNY